MLVGIEDLLGSKQKIAGVYIDKARQENGDYANVYKFYFELMQGQKYTDELWLTEKELLKLMAKALELNKKQRYALVKSNYRAGHVWVDREYKDNYGNKMRIVSIGNSYKVQWKREGERVYKLSSSSEDLQAAIRDIETIVDDIGGTK